jgi:hypothetical protein
MQRARASPRERNIGTEGHGGEMMKVTTEAQLAEAIRNREDFIEVEGNLKNMSLKIRATGKVVWGIVSGLFLLLLAVILAAPVGGPVGVAAAAVPAGAAGAGLVAILGAAATASAVKMIRAFGGVEVLEKLREYEQIPSDGENLLLRRK